jgi:hypothetical protein
MGRAGGDQPMTIKRSFNIGIAVLLFSSLVILAPGSKSADKVTAILS